MNLKSLWLASEREIYMDTNQFKFLMYRSADGDVSVNAIIKDETIWLTCYHQRRNHLADPEGHGRIVWSTGSGD